MMSERHVPPRQEGRPAKPSAAHGRLRSTAQAALGVAAKRKVPETVARKGQPMDLPARAILVREGHHTDEIFLVETGAMMLTKVLRDGRRQVIGFRLPGDVIWFRGRGVPWSATLQAIKPSRVRRIAWSAVHRCLESDPGLCDWVIGLAGDEIAAAQVHLLTVGRRNKEERLAAFLLEMWLRTGDRSPQAPEIALPMHRLEIADYLGLTTETVSRVFARLAKDGVIALPHPSRIVLLRLAALEALALGLPEAQRAD